MPTRIVLCAALLVALSTPSSAKIRSAQEQMRAEAERACYLDAKTLCPGAIPDEAKVTACFTKKRAQLSPACGRIFDRGI